jgi:NADH-quinone oxidoreductase subunit N
MPNIASLTFFTPELILSFFAVLLFVVGLFFKKSGGLAAVSALGVLLAIVAAVFMWNMGSPPLFWGMIILDKPAVFFKVIILLSALMIFSFPPPVGDGTRAGERPNPSEYYSLILGLVLGSCLLSGANNLLMIYLSLEFASLMSYILTGFVPSNKSSGEAAMKYVLYGAVASGVFLFGASLYFGSTGTLDISLIAPQRSGILLTAGVLMLAGFLYKIAAFPMHAWCPDAYQGAPTPITALLSVAPKAAGFMVLMRVFSNSGSVLGWQQILAFVSLFTMTFGNLAAIPQNDIKRLLAYSSIAHAGYLLIGVACATPAGYQAVYFYFIAYLLMNIGAFAVVQLVETSPNGTQTLASFVGLGRRGAAGTTAAIAMTIFLLSLTGIPPLIGFVGKFYIFAAALDARLYWLAIAGIVNSVISLYYYMRIVRAMFFEETTDHSALVIGSRALYAAVIALALLVLALGLAWQPLSRIVSNII